MIISYEPKWDLYGTYTSTKLVFLHKQPFLTASSSDCRSVPNRCDIFRTLASLILRFPLAKCQQLLGTNYSSLLAEMSPWWILSWQGIPLCQIIPDISTRIPFRTIDALAIVCSTETFTRALHRRGWSYQAWSSTYRESIIIIIIRGRPEERFRLPSPTASKYHYATQYVADGSEHIPTRWSTCEHRVPGVRRGTSRTVVPRGRRVRVLLWGRWGSP